MFLAYLTFKITFRNLYNYVRLDRKLKEYIYSKYAQSTKNALK